MRLSSEGAYVCAAAAGGSQFVWLIPLWENIHSVSDKLLPVGVSTHNYWAGGFKGNARYCEDHLRENVIATVTGTIMPVCAKGHTAPILQASVLNLPGNFL